MDVSVSSSQECIVKTEKLRRSEPLAGVLALVAAKPLHPAVTVGPRAPRQTLAPIHDKLPVGLPDIGKVPHVPAADHAVASATLLMSPEVTRLPL